MDRVALTDASDIMNVMGLYDVRRFGSLNSSDNTGIFQDAMDTAYFDKMAGIFIPQRSAVMPFSQLRVLPGMSIISAGIITTRLAQLPGVNASAIVNDPVLMPNNYYMHGQVFEGFKIGKLGTEDTIGCGIEFQCRTGEGFRIAKINALSFPEAGIRLARGGAPCYLEDLHFFRNGTYGLDIQRTGSDVWNMFQCVVLSGDNNGNALVRIKNCGVEYEAFSFIGVKAEVGTAGKQLNVFELDNLRGVQVYIHNISGLVAADGAPNAFVRIMTSGARVSLIGARGVYPLAINDTVRPQQVFHSTNRMELVYSTGNGILRETIG